MKLMFSIKYKTPFGQSMHVVVNYLAEDGRMRPSNLTMHTDDGLLWTAETTGLLQRHAPIKALAYTYRVEDDHGKVMRAEWDAVPRLYNIDTSRSYIFTDIWRDLSVHHYLYLSRQERMVTALSALPCFNRSVVFRVSAPQVREGYEVAVLGSEPSLGVWNERRYLPMRYIGNGDWMLTINAYAMTLPFEFKYVVVDQQTHDIAVWENGENRQTALKSLDDGQQLVVYGGNLRVPCELSFHDEWLDKESTIEYEIRELYI